MPAEYEAIRDSIYQDLVKKKGWSKSRALKEAKRRAAIVYYRRHGRAVRHES